MKKQIHLLPFLSLFLATFIYSIYNVFFRIIGYNLPLYFQSAARNLLIALFLLIFAKPLMQIRRMNKKDFRWILFRSFSGCVCLIAYYMAINFMEIGTVYFVFYASATIFSYLIGKILFQESMTPVKLMSLFLSLIGLFTIYAFKVSLDKMFYLFLTIISGLGWAFWSTFSKKISNKFSAMDLTFFDAFIAVFIYLGTSLIMQEKWVLPSLSIPWMANYSLGILMIITSLLVVYGFKHLEAQIGSLIMLNEIVFGVIVGFVFYQEVLPLSSYLGGFLIVAGAVLPKALSKLTYKRKKAINGPQKTNI